MKHIRKNIRTDVDELEEEKKNLAAFFVYLGGNLVQVEILFKYFIILMAKKRRTEREKKNTS